VPITVLSDWVMRRAQPWRENGFDTAMGHSGLVGNLRSGCAAWHRHGVNDVRYL
jgi:hypothetical protein